MTVRPRLALPHFPLAAVGLRRAAIRPIAIRRITIRHILRAGMLLLTVALAVPGCGVRRSDLGEIVTDPAQLPGTGQTADEVRPTDAASEGEAATGDAAAAESPKQ